MPEDVTDLARMIDHSLLHPTLTECELRDGCALAARWRVASVCIKPYAVALAAELLAGSGVAVGTVVGFPHGSSSSAIKLAEGERACDEGAGEIDMVINIGHALGGDWDAVRAEIQAVQDTVVARGALLKVIFENDFLQPAHIEKLCGICNAVGVAFTKTSTGFGFVKQDDGRFAARGATHEDLRLMCRLAAPGVQVKAAGGVRTLEDLLAVRAIGVTRVGATATEAILAAAAEPA